ncbi:unnamed protein product [Owenia fusiformis]|uniref:Sodium/calcium exchanger membrane region domain-containing protein n=1 Tax=Owenia fusiformis TaxID=6347 RepID=A0A8J1TMQ9_OWEFU|nr:unnamed protein product [Owenia fusiformis]
MKDGDMGMSVGGLLGAGVFVSTVVAGAIAFVRPFTCMKRPHIRDILFYITSVGWTFAILHRKRVYLGEAIGFMGFYAVYVIVVVVSRKVFEKRELPRKLSRASELEKSGDTQSIQRSMSVSSDVPFSEVSDKKTYDISFIDVTELIGGKESIPSSNGHVNSAFEGDMDPVIKKELEAAKDAEPGATKGSLLSQFLWKICPIDVDGFGEMNIIVKIYEIIKAPIIFALTITVPVVNYEEDMNNWNKILTMIHCVTGPVWFVMAGEVGTTMIGGRFPVWALILIIGVVAACIVFFTSKYDQPPIYHWLFAYIGFLIAIIWIYTICNEIVNILESYGVVFNISKAILGLTLLAWGNSVGDLIANTVMARKGEPRMGFAACFGGPTFNLLLGVGIPFTIRFIRRRATDEIVKFTLQQTILCAGVWASMLFSIVVVPVLKFKVSKIYGICLFILYISFLTIALLAETKVIRPAQGIFDE